MHFAKSLAITTTAAAILFAGMSFTASAAHASETMPSAQGQTAECHSTKTIDGVQYCETHTTQGTYYRVQGFERNDGMLDIPATINSSPVTGIGVNGDAIFNKENVKTVRIHGDISVNAHAFDDADNLTSVDLSAAKNLWLGTNAFARTDALTTVQLPADDGTNHVSLGKKVFDASIVNLTVILNDPTGFVFPHGQADFVSNNVVVKNSGEEVDTSETTETGSTTEQGSEEQGTEVTVSETTDLRINENSAQARSGATFWDQGVRYVEITPEDGSSAYWVVDRFDGYSDDIMHVHASVNGKPVLHIGFAGTPLENSVQITHIVAEGDIAIMPQALTEANNLMHITVTSGSVIADNALHANVQVTVRD